MTNPWNALKLKVLNHLMYWVAGQMWEVAREVVSTLIERDDLDGPAKLALARDLLLDRARQAGASLSVSLANFLLEAAVQWIRQRMGR